jgi:hypothetical protein
MNMMNETERKKLITSVIEYGGLGLRRQALRVHKNGAKIPISKNYIDDEVLSPKNTYTVILIPESKIAANTSIILSFFNRKKGPIVFHSYPENALIEPEIIEITQNMTHAFRKEFFVQYSSTIPSSLNYYFEIHSDWARGKKEMLLLSIMINKPITPIMEKRIQPICVDFATQIKNEENTFKALYIDNMESRSMKDQSEIKLYYNGLKERIKHFYIQLIESLQS